MEDKTINASGYLMSLKHPMVMGIINVTPDSFYAGSRVSSADEVVDKADAMLREGADMLDLGAQSTRPGAQIISEKDEWERLSNVLPRLIKAFPQAVISIDTFYASVARKAVECGVSIVNDVSGGRMDEKMFSTVAELRVPYILMHSRGNAQTMQALTNYDDVVEDVLRFFHQKIDALRRLGHSDIIVDPGFGFAKTPQQSFDLLRAIDALSILDVPMLAGVSRKSMVYKTLGVQPEDALHGTTALHMWCLLQGVRILRVHDVTAAKHVVEMHKQLCG